MLADLKIGIVGGGLMGHGIAQVLAGKGAAVTVHDPDQATLNSVPERIAKNLATLNRDTAIAQHVNLAQTLEEVAQDADVVFEAAPERMALKQDIFARLDEIARPEAILASNTSVMRITEIAAKTQRPERVVGTHWWNPPYLVPLVEVVQGERTADETVRRTIELLDEATRRRSTSSATSPASSATASSTPCGARRSSSSTKGSATRRRSTPSSRRASATGSPSSGQWRTPTSSAST
jgi:3-hydroxybutyryl-CoA dehydrogenase